MASVGKHIRRIRTERHMTQEQLAEKLFVTRQAVSAWETDKAQPDVETLERIAQALGVEVTEVIYGVPLSPNLRKVKRRWALIGGLFVSILSLTFIILLENGTIGTLRGGLHYHLHSGNYYVSYEELPTPQTVELNLKDLESNRDTILYEDESGCKIVVSDVNKIAPYQYRVFLRSEGTATRQGGRLVSLIPREWRSPFSLSTSYIGSEWPAATASAGGLTRSCPLSSFAPLKYTNGDEIVLHLSSTDNRNTPVFYTGFLEEQEGTVTLTIPSLFLLTTHRAGYWNLYTEPFFFLNFPAKSH
ncbi:MAG: helix-turn-helix transcriptional regulator [Oscillospiraceae bacterium]|nr:helix-turn-helix transcriptional regulator [Oscillospiraceae bacterium]